MLGQKSRYLPFGSGSQQVSVVASFSGYDFYKIYSHVPHDDVLVNGTLHRPQCFHKIVMELNLL